MDDREYPPNSVLYISLSDTQARALGGCGGSGAVRVTYACPWGHTTVLPWSCNTCLEKTLEEVIITNHYSVRRERDIPVKEEFLNIATELEKVRKRTGKNHLTPEYKDVYETLSRTYKGTDPYAFYTSASRLSKYGKFRRTFVLTGDLEAFCQMVEAVTEDQADTLPDYKKKHIRLNPVWIVPSIAIILWIVILSLTFAGTLH